MPHAAINGAKLHYTDTGAGAETIFFVHGLAFDGRMFDAQIDHLKSRYRCISMDLRGHGQSELSEGGYEMDSLAADAVGLIEHLGCGPCHFVGWSIGGFMGLRIAIKQPTLLRSLVLIGAGSMAGSEADFGFKMVPHLTRFFGMGPVIGALMSSMFAPTFLKDPARAQQKEMWRTRFRANQAMGVSRAARGVIAQSSVDEGLGSIVTPTLMLQGEFDNVLPMAIARRTAEKIRGSKLVVIERAGHAVTMEEPAQVERALDTFLAGLPNVAQAASA